MKKALIPILLLSLSSVLYAGNAEVQVIDGLMWQDNQESKSIKKNWKDANSYCKKLDLSGYTDWSLPNKEQLKSLWKNRSKLNNLGTKQYWSSSVYSNSDAWHVNVVYGAAADYASKSIRLKVRCMRGE